MNDSVSTLPMDDNDDGNGSSANRFSTSCNFNEAQDEKDDGTRTGNMTSRGMLRNGSKRYSVVDRRQQKQNHHSPQAEQRLLLADRDDSDLEHNIGRLCQYLSGSEDGDEEDFCKEPEEIPSSIVNGSILQRSNGLSLNSRQNYQKRSVGSGTSSSVVSDENFNFMHEQMPSQQQQSDNSAQVIPMQRLVPRDFLNIPPPAQPPPPEESPSSGRPLPPQRTLPPLPDEPVYEEAKPAPPPTMPRSSKQQWQQPNKNGALGIRPTTASGKVSAVVSPVMASSCLAPLQHDDEALEKPLYLSQGSQYNDIDWRNYETSVLERTEAGSFYIPSGQTTMSSISPSRKSEIDQQKHNNYLLSPAAQSTVPVPVLPIRQEASGANHRFFPQSRHPKDKMENSFSGKQSCSSFYTWKCMTYLLAVGMVFLLGAFIYLIHAHYTSSTPDSIASSNAPPVSPYGSSSQFWYPTYSSTVWEDTNQAFSSPSLRPLPESFALGDDVVADLLPRHLAQTYFTLQRNSYVQFNVTIDPQTKLAFYGRQTLPASPTQYDFVRIVQGIKFHTRRFDSRRKIRAPGDLRRLPENLRSTTFVQYLSGGRWHLSILNDDTEMRTIRFAASLTDSEKEECKNNCHNKGVCKEGKCYCFDGFTGAYCEETFCPVLCSGNGIFAGGKCHCHHGWKGADCDVPSNVCEVPNCNGHGHCNNKGECVCNKGYKGPFCEQRECPHENCSGHGVCHNGKCYCDFGYKGDRCDEVYTSEGLCPASASRGQCNGRGHLNAVSGICNCEQGWLGDHCEKRLCHTNCGAHGKCINDACVCDEGFLGEKCDQLSCAPGCEDNGKCSNGTCLCNDGWNGENCQLAGCPNACSQRGKCRKAANVWRCICPADFGGDDCGIPLERQCSDGVDNDSDGLVDCEDSECCSSVSCQNDQYCRTVPDPYQVLIRKPSASPQASFFQKTAFLLDPDSVQQYPDVSLFNESRASVVRGRVVNARGSSLMAVRIANSANALYGFTLSRAGGYFDLMVDGGGAITLQFMRKPFLTHYTTVVVPWNQIVYIGDVMMLAKDDSSAARDSTDRWSQACLHVFKGHTIKPYALPSWKYGRPGATSSASGIVADAAAVQESLRIPGTDIFLTYLSANAVGRASTLSLYLVPDSPPKDLRLVRLMIDVEGVHFEATLEAKANLSFIYGWDKKNVYKQQVIGLAAAKVSIGYVYANCERVFWETLNVKLNGHAGSISEIGGWNLNIHHRYNILDSVLEKGDGGAVYLREELSVLVSTMGTKDQRPLSCSPPVCNGPASTAQLYLPMAISSSRDGSLFVGDYNLIRWLNNSNTLSTVLELSIADTAHRYFLAVHPISGDVYLSLPLRRQVWKIRSLTPSAADLTTNYDIVVGSGEICSVDSDCGDGASAEVAALTYPKGIAFDVEGNLYIADDRRVRLVSTSGFMSTVVGASPVAADGSTSAWRPLPCSNLFDARSFHPQWPTSLTFDYYSGNLLFLDTDVIFELSASKNYIAIRAGAPSHCSQLVNAKNETVRPTLLRGATAIAAADDGRILITETDKKRMHRIRSFDRYGRAILLAGAESKCDCHRRHCPCDDDESVAGRDAHLHNPTSIAVDQRGNIHVADEGNLKIRTLRFSVPTLDPTTKLYEILAADTQEIFYFNRFGQHVTTKDMLTDRFIYNFTYHLDTSYGKLSHVTGTGGHKIYITRKSATKIFIENTSGLKSTVHINQFDQMLEKFVSPTGAESHFSYEINTGLLSNKVDSRRRAWFYEYDANGRLTRAILPTGEILVLKYGLLGDRLLVDVKNENGLDWRLAVSDVEMKIRGEPRERSVFMPGDSVYHIYTPDDVSVQYDSSVHSISDASSQSTVLRRKLFLPATIEPPRPSKTLKVEWRYYVRRSGRSYKRVAQVNGVNVLTVEYDREKNVDVILNQNNDKILTVYYNAAGFVTQWASASSNIDVMNITFDSMGRVVSHNWASVSRSYVYDREGRVIETGDSADAYKRTKKFRYTRENSWPSSVELPSKLRYELGYDPSGSLANITSPSGFVRRYFKQTEMIGSTNYLYYHPNASKPHVLSKRLDGTISASYYGNGQKRVAYLYDAISRLCKIIFDHAEFAIEYHPKTGLLSTRRLVDNGKTRSELNYGYQGNLLVEILDRRWSITDDAKSTLPVVSHWFYQYDDRLRLRSIQSLFDDTASRSYKIEYDSLTGRLTSVNGYQLQYNDNKVRMQNEMSSEETTFSTNMAISQTKFTVKGRVVSEQRMLYDSAGRMISATMNADGEQGAVSYEYDDNGRLTAAKLSHNGVDHTWSYSYYADGDLEKVNDVQLIYDKENGHLEKYGTLNYVTDENGFIIQRGLDNFDFDSLGRLTRAWQPGSYDCRYFYDHVGRLVSVERSTKTSWHFYYALLHKPNLITHAYDVGKRVQIVFTYDQNDRLIAMETNGAYYFVVTHPSKTPMHVFSDDGTLAKTVIRSPVGVVTADTSPDLVLFIGYKGQYQDLDNGLVIFEDGRPFDPNVGRYLSAPVESFFNVDAFHPESTLNPFIRDPREAVIELRTFDLSIADWLKYNGYDAGDIASWLHTASESKFPCGGNGLLRISNECWIQKKISSFHTLLSVHRSPLLPHKPFDRMPVSFAAVASFYGDGVVLANKSNVVDVRLADALDRPTQEPLIRLLNHSSILPVSYVNEGTIVYYFWKKDINKATADWATLGLRTTETNGRVARVNVSLNTVTVGQGETRREIIVAAPSAEMRILYGGETAQKEIRILVDETLNKAADALWIMEKAKALRPLPRNSQWSDKELLELKEKGRVYGYSPEYRMDPLAHPALLADPNNVKFVKR